MNNIHHDGQKFKDLWKAESSQNKKQLKNELDEKQLPQPWVKIPYSF